MRFEILYSLLQNICAFSKKTYSSIAKMTEKSPYLRCSMTMIDMQSCALKWTIWNWNRLANETFIVLLFNHFIELKCGYAISFFNRAISLILDKLSFLFRILSSNLKSMVMAFFAFIGSTQFHSGILMKTRKHLICFTSNTIFKFVIHI